jgi:hypothetical protein
MVDDLLLLPSKSLFEEFLLGYMNREVFWGVGGLKCV